MMTDTKTKTEKVTKWFTHLRNCDDNLLAKIKAWSTFRGKSIPVNPFSILIAAGMALEDQFDEFSVKQMDKESKLKSAQCIHNIIEEGLEEIKATEKKYKVLIDKLEEEVKADLIPS